MTPSYRYRASSPIRTLIVALSTLAMVGVCFGIYQLSQSPPAAEAKPQPRPRLPNVTVDADGEDGDGMGDPATAPGVKIGGGIVGPGREVRFSIYGTQGDRARAEISMHSWTPVKGAPNELDVVQPEIRMMTGSGNAIKASARAGVLETHGKIGGDWDVRRGRLVGDVVIEIDRLSERDRAKLPDAVRNKIDPSQLIRIEADEIVFDREYSKVTIDGPFTLTARDALVQTAKVEMRFNEKAGRLEYCRIGSGGRIELRQVPDGMGYRLPGLVEDPNRRTSVSDWLGAAVRSVLAARHELVTREKPNPEQPPEGEGLPVFGSGSDESTPAAPKASQPYRASFSGAIRVRQLVDGKPQSELLADELDIYRDFSREDRARMTASGAGGTRKTEQSAGAPAPQTPSEAVVITWKGRLFVQAVTPGVDDASEGQGPEASNSITALGSPVMVTSKEGLAECGTLQFAPDSGGVVLTGTEAVDARVKLFGNGLIIGREIRFQQVEDKIHLQVVGPGRLYRDDVTKPNNLGREAKPDASQPAIEFASGLEVDGSLITETLINLRGSISKRQVRVIDRAVFTGRSTLRDANTTLSSDRLEVDFSAEKTSSGIVQGYRSLRGRGNVLMTQDADRMTCDEIDVALGTDDGKPTPRQVVARGSIHARQGTRSIQCDEVLKVDFKIVAQALGPFDPVAAYQEALHAGRDVGAIDWREVRKAHETGRKRRAVVSRLRATRDVAISDPRQQLEVLADRVDCTVAAGQRISHADIAGLAGQPASLRLEQLTLVAETIQLDAEREEADVPGAGMMTFLSEKDLDGKRVAVAVPIVIGWGESMRFRGGRNEAEFFGGVHAASESGSTFDCDRLLVQFDEVGVAPKGRASVTDWWILSALLDSADSRRGLGSDRLDLGALKREPAYLLATGHAKATTKQYDETGEGMIRRAMIAGPRLSVNLREGVSKMLIEGPGSLLLEDFRPADQNSVDAPRKDTALFEIGRHAGPSKTPILWQELMWYDFGEHVARFEGDVDLKHFSGRQLERRFGGDRRQVPLQGEKDQPLGRATFLNCDKLTVTFATEEMGPTAGNSRVAGLSAGALSSFQADGHVKLIDETEGLIVQGWRMGFDRPRDLLSVYGSGRHLASFIQQRPGQLPQKASARRFRYNVSSRSLSASEVRYEGR